MYFNGKVATTPLPSDFYSLSYSWGGGMIIPLFFFFFFFLRNDSKGWGNDYLDPLLGEFSCFRTAS